MRKDNYLFPKPKIRHDYNAPPFYLWFFFRTVSLNFSTNSASAKCYSSSSRRPERLMHRDMIRIGIFVMVHNMPLVRWSTVAMVSGRMMTRVTTFVNRGCTEIGVGITATLVPRDTKRSPLAFSISALLTAFRKPVVKPVVNQFKSKACY